MHKKHNTLYSGNQIGQSILPDPGSTAKQEIIQCIEEHIDQLLSIIRSYVLRFGLASGNDASAVALDVLQEVVVEALTHSENFVGPKQPLAWLLGIAINVIRRKRVTNAKRYRRETPLEPSFLFEDAYDSLHSYPVPLTDGPEQIVEEAEQVGTLLALVPEADRALLQLAVLDGVKREAIATELGITPDAARSRLYRALGRLRKAWHKHYGQQLEGGK